MISHSKGILFRVISDAQSLPYMKRTMWRFRLLVMCVVQFTQQVCVVLGQVCYMVSLAFQYLPPNSARTGYTIEGALFISTQLSTNALSAV